MPELAEVAWYAARWQPAVDCRVREVRCHPRARVFRGMSPEELHVLRGDHLRGLLTHGKQILARFDHGALGLHLGMSGEMACAPVGHTPGRHDHLVLRTEAGSLVFRDPRMFGRVRWVAGSALPAWWKALPPAILSDAFTSKLVEQGLAARGRRPLKAVLLDQDLFPGVGNWMADEILWRLGWHPARRSGELQTAEINVLRREARRVCRDALRVIGRSWGDPPASWLFPHRWRAGGCCPRDGRALERTQVAGRTTAWCAACQPPAGSSAGGGD